MKTKNWMLVLAAWMLSTAVLFGQSAFSLGVKGGATATNLKLPKGLDQIDQIPEFEAIANPTFGLVGEWRVAPFFALQPELNFTTKGFKVRQDGAFQLFGVDVPAGVVAYTEFNYMELPLLAKATFGKGSVQGYVSAGPVVGYALDGRLNTRATVLVEIDLTDTPINLENINYERFEAGLVAGAGMSVAALHGQFFVDGRFQHGLTEVYDLPLIHDKLQFRGLSLTAGYAYRF